MATKTPKSRVADLAKLVKSDADAVKAAVENAIGSFKSAKDAINVAAACCVMHYLKHGNATLATTLVDGLDSGFKVNNLKAWFESQGMRWDSDEKKFKKSPKGFDALTARRAEAKTEARFATQLVQSVMNASAKPEAPFKGFVFEKELAKLIARGRKLQQQHANDKAKLEKIDLTGMEKYESLLDDSENDNETETNDDKVVEVAA